MSILRSLAIMLAGVGLVLIDGGELPFPPIPIPIPTPTPTPEPEPVPGPRQAVIVEESGDRTPERAAAFQRVQAEYDRVFIVDPDDRQDSSKAVFHPYIAAADRVPWVIVTDFGGNVLHSSDCPGRYDELKALLDSYDVGEGQ